MSSHQKRTPLTRKRKITRSKGSDVFSRRQRSAIMARVRSQNTSPERAVRSLVRQLGYRFCSHARHLPGKPDIVFSRRKVAIFVHGCWWHGHRCSRGARVPKTNIDYWINKVANNKRRDRRVRRQLANLGWKSLVIWECQTSKPWLTERIAKAVESSSVRAKCLVKV